MLSRTLLTAGGIAAGVCLLVPAALRRGLAAVTVQGSSMEPTYQHGDRVLVRHARNVSAGQIVVVERPTPQGHWPAPPLRRGGGGDALPAQREWLIKRAVATSGDPVPHDLTGALRTAPGGRVPPGAVVLLGDSPENGFDSRLVGFFPLDRILGTVLCAFPHHDPGRI
ncbi:S26 family signal peptidase [Streptomyces iconiensis]|uniref:S26 family signal peptidase n=1 Tax=Streptomyces iconiensis TaxID=1384038 RepID=A0ABT7A9F5_9ACTN|nr:S26 family signal peptidase [Streptomyces iconiensis]MDJ1137961.1 S26 family signal peptidase [Streptomyces iconiensis]